MKTTPDVTPPVQIQLIIVIIDIKKGKEYNSKQPKVKNRSVWMTKGYSHGLWHNVSYFIDLKSVEG